MLRQKPSTGLNTLHKSQGNLLTLHLLHKHSNYVLPLLIPNLLGDASVSYYFHIAFLRRHKNQNTGPFTRMMQDILQKLPSRHVGGTPVAHGFRNNALKQRLPAKCQPKRDKD